MSRPPKTSEQCIYIVDDDEALRDSLVWLLESHGYQTEVYESAERFLANYNAEMAGCLLLDIRMSGMSGLELYDALRQQYCILPVIFITGHGDVPMAVSALKKGAVDFIEKPFNDRDMLKLIEQCLVSERGNREKRNSDAETAKRLNSLTHREREVLDLIVAGNLNKQIANTLGISIKTVEVHRARVMEKMESTSLAQLVQSVLTAESDNSRSESSSE